MVGEAWLERNADMSDAESSVMVYDIMPLLEVA
jgi:hypothetical protein